MELKIEHLEDFALGTAFLGTGGGGDPYMGRLIAQHAMQEHGEPTIIDPQDVPDDAMVYTIAIMGAPTVIYEKALCGEDAEIAVSKLEKHIGKPAYAILPVEIGGINSTLPLMLAARRGLPLVNADGMGRAFPEIQMTTFNAMGNLPTPLVIADDHLNTCLVESSDAKTSEDLGRALAIRMGLSVMISCYPLTGAQLKASAIPGTLTLALNIGRAISRGRSEGDPIKTLIEFLRSTPDNSHAEVLFDGKIVDLIRETTQGFSKGTCVLGALDGGSDTMKIQFQNENLVAILNGKVVATVPDLICMVDRETAEPITTETLKYGQRVKVLGASVGKIMRTPEAINTFGPRCFGLDLDYVAIEELVRR